MAEEHDILTASEVAAWLRIAVSTVYDWAGKATIPSIRLNGCLRFDRKELTRWIAQARTGTSCSRSESGIEQSLDVGDPLSRAAMSDAGRQVIRAQRLAGRCHRGR